MFRRVSEYVATRLKQARTDNISPHSFYRARQDGRTRLQIGLCQLAISLPLLRQLCPPHASILLFEKHFQKACCANLIPALCQDDGDGGDDGGEGGDEAVPPTETTGESLIFPTISHFLVPCVPLVN